MMFAVMIVVFMAALTVVVLFWMEMAILSVGPQFLFREAQVQYRYDFTPANLII